MKGRPGASGGHQRCCTQPWSSGPRGARLGRGRDRDSQTQLCAAAVAVVLLVRTTMTRPDVDVSPRRHRRERGSTRTRRRTRARRRLEASPSSPAGPSRSATRNTSPVPGTSRHSLPRGRRRRLCRCRNPRASPEPGLAQIVGSERRAGRWRLAAREMPAASRVLDDEAQLPVVGVGDEAPQARAAFLGEVADEAVLPGHDRVG